jgi:hypothetical protein
MKIIDRLAGIGQVYHSGNMLGEFTYGITVFQESGPLKLMTGFISMEPKKVGELMDAKDDKLELRLEDGRKLHFYFASTDGKIQPTGSFY